MSISKSLFLLNFFISIIALGDKELGMRVLIITEEDEFYIPLSILYILENFPYGKREGTMDTEPGMVSAPILWFMKVRRVSVAHMRSSVKV